MNRESIILNRLGKIRKIKVTVAESEKALPPTRGGKNEPPFPERIVADICDLTYSYIIQTQTQSS